MGLGQEHCSGVRAGARLLPHSWPGGGGFVRVTLSTARFIAARLISLAHPVPVPLQAPQALHQRGIFFNK